MYEPATGSVTARTSPAADEAAVTRHTNSPTRTSLIIHPSQAKVLTTPEVKVIRPLLSTAASAGQHPAHHRPPGDRSDDAVDVDVDRVLEAANPAVRLWSE